MSPNVKDWSLISIHFLHNHKNCDFYEIFTLAYNFIFLFTLVNFFFDIYLKRFFLYEENIYKTHFPPVNGQGGKRCYPHPLAHIDIPRYFTPFIFSPSLLRPRYTTLPSYHHFHSHVFFIKIHTVEKHKCPKKMDKINHEKISCFFKKQS